MMDKPHILMDDCKGGYLVIKHLLDCGHRKILGIFKADDFQGKERHKGICESAQESGLSMILTWWYGSIQRTGR